MHARYPRTYRAFWRENVCHGYIRRGTRWRRYPVFLLYPWIDEHSCQGKISFLFFCVFFLFHFNLSVLFLNYKLLGINTYTLMYDKFYPRRMCGRVNGHFLPFVQFLLLVQILVVKLLGWTMLGFFSMSLFWHFTMYVQWLFF